MSDVFFSDMQSLRIKRQDLKALEDNLRGELKEAIEHTNNREKRMVYTEMLMEVGDGKNGGVSVNDWMFESHQFVQRMRLNTNAFEEGLRQSVIKALANPRIGEEERMRLANILHELKQNGQDNQP